MITEPHNNNTRAQWSSLWGYLLVTTGMVVGLGNIFGFPYLVTKHGSLFILCYLGFELLLGIPVFLAEALIGRRGRQNPIGSISILAMEGGASRHWRKVGWLYFAALFLMVSYYSVESSFPLAYFVDALTTTIKNFGVANVSVLPVTNFELNVAPSQVIFLLAFLIATFLVTARGINRGLESISRITVPFFFITFSGLAIYSCYVGNFKMALMNLVHFDLHHLTFDMVFVAFTYAFFKLASGMGTMIVYGSYLPLTARLGRSTLVVVCFDAIASLVSYFIIYPTMLNNSGLTQSFSNLSYHSIPNIFSHLPGGGQFVTVLFFFATVIAAWMPTIAFTEGITLTLVERLNLTRYKATLLAASAITTMACTVLLFYAKWPKVKLFGTWTVRSVVPDLSSDVLTPLAALLISLFVGWVVEKEISAAELRLKPALFSCWYVLIRYVAPVLCVTLLVANIILSFLR